MTKQAIPCILVMALAATGCGWFDSTPAVPEDGDVAVDEVPAEEAPNEMQDPPADQADGREDPAVDVPGEEIAPDEEETAPDVEPDTADTVDAVDAVEEDAVSPCLPLEGTIGGVDSWTDGMTNTTIATFNLALSNNNNRDSSCGFSEITVVEGSLKLAGSTSVILTYETVGPTGSMPGTLQPGEGLLAAFRAECSPCAAPCDTDVVIEVSIEYMIDRLAALPIRVESAPVQHICVY